MKKDSMMKNEKKRMNTPKTLEMIMNKAVSAKQMVQHKRFNRKFLAKTHKSTENIQKTKRDMLQRHTTHLFRGDLSVDTNASPCAQHKGQRSLYALSFSIDFLSLVLPNMHEIHIRSFQNQSDELVPTLVSLSSETSGGDSIASEHTGQTALGKDRVQETINCASNIDCFFNSQSPRSVDALECTSSIPINVDFVLESNEEEIASFANERIQRRHYRDAIDIYESVLSHFRKCYGNDHQLVMDTLNNLCISNTLNGNYSQALSYGQEALSLRRKNLGKNHMDVASSLSELGIVFYAREDFDKSLSSFREAMQIYSKAPDCAERSTRICSLLNNIGCVHYSMGKVATSLSTFNECLGLQRSFMGKLTGDTMSKVLYNMSITLCNTGIVTSKQGNLDNALSLLEEGLMVQYSVLPDDHRMITTVQKAKKRLEGIQEPLSPKMERIKLEFDIDPQEKGNSKNRPKGALGMSEMHIDQEWNGYCADMISLGSIRVEPESHQQISLNMNINTLSQALTDEGRSKRHCSWVDVRKSKSFPSEKGGDFFQITSNACNYIERGDLENAIRVFENARKGAKNKCGDVEYILAAISHCMGIIYLYTGNYHQALACFKHAIQMRSKVLDKDAIDLMDSQHKYALTLIALKDYDTALSKLQTILHSSRKKYGYQHDKVAILLNNIACCHYWLGGHLSASKTFEEAAEIFKESKHRHLEAGEMIKISILLGRCLKNLGFVRSRRSDNSEAIVALEEVLVLTRRVYGKSHPLVNDCLDQLSYVMAIANSQNNKISVDSVSKQYSEMLLN